MSYNLKCDGLKLRQTPSEITEMCLSINPKTGKPDGGHEGVRRRYLIWVRGERQSVLNNAKTVADRTVMASVFDAHINEVQQLSQPKFYGI